MGRWVTVSVNNPLHALRPPMYSSKSAHTFKYLRYSLPIRGRYCRLMQFTYINAHVPTVHSPVWGRGTPLSHCPFTSSSFPPFYFSLSFIGFTYFLLLSIPSLSTRIAPLRFQAGGRRRRPNLGLVCVLLCNLCYLYSLVKMDCGVLFYLV